MTQDEEIEALDRSLERMDKTLTLHLKVAGVVLSCVVLWVIGFVVWAVFFRR